MKCIVFLRGLSFASGAEFEAPETANAPKGVCVRSVSDELDQRQEASDHANAFFDGV